MALSPETLLSSYAAPPEAGLRRWRAWMVPAVLMLVDAAVIEATFLFGWTTRAAATPLFGKTLNPLTFHQGAVFLLILLPAFAAARLYPGYGMSPVEQLRRRVGTIVVVLFGFFVFDRVFLEKDQSRAVLFIVLIGLIVLSPLASICVRAALAEAGRWGTPTVIIGADRNAREVAACLKRYADPGLRPVGFLDDDASPGSILEGLPVIGTISGARMEPALAGFRGVAVLPGPIRTGAAADLLTALPFERVIVIPDVDGIAGQRVRLAEVGGMPGFDLRRESRGRPARLLKRAADLALAVPLLVLAMPLMLMVAVAVRLDSRGPVLFRQERYGVFGSRFVLLKFRTMQVDAAERLARLLEADPAMRAEYERFHKLRRDPRITRLGRFLRKTSLDELPQLWNVVRGDMSLVGPRPYMPGELDLADDADRTILGVKPGISGLWQVSARNKVGFGERKEMDRWYVRHWSVWLDFHLLLLTVHALLSPRHAS